MEKLSHRAAEESETATLSPHPGTAAGSGSGGSGRAGGADGPGETFIPGELVAGRFRILRFLGQGGMAQVFEAEDLELGQDVAIKVVRPELAASRDARELLRREVLLARRVTHPNVCRIFDVFQHAAPAPVAAEGNGAAVPSTLVLVMELLRGETLAQRLARGGPLRPAEALPIIRQLAEALHAAHRSQVTHGDFKSGNVILEPSVAGPRAVVTDFGLAQHSAAATRCVGGTTAYMAPEQLLGGQVTPASDLYALGVVIHEMVVGRRPAPGRQAGVVRGEASGERYPREAEALNRLPSRWREVVESCLARLPGGRPASALEVARSLSPGRPSLLRALRLAARSWRRPPVRAGALCLLAAGLGMAAAGPSPSKLPRKAPGAAVAGGDPRPAVAARPSVAIGVVEESPPGKGPPWLPAALGHLLLSEIAGGGEVEAFRPPACEECDGAARPGPAGGANPPSPMPSAAGVARSWPQADFSVGGSFRLSRGGDDPTIEIDLAMRRVASGRVVTVLNVGAPLSHLAAAAARLADGIRRFAGAPESSPADREAAAASRPASLQAEGFYAEGEALLAQGDPLAAFAALTRARDADPDFPLTHAALARASAELGYDRRARDEATAAEKGTSRLPERWRLDTAAISRRMEHNLSSAAGLYRVLWALSPHDLGQGLQLAETQLEAARPREAVETLREVRARGVDAMRAPYVELLEARARNQLADFRAALAAALAAEERAERVGQTFVLAAAEIEEADARAAAGDRAGATRALAAAHDLDQRLGFRGGEGEILRRLALLAWRAGKTQQALALDEQALAIFEQAPSIGGSARTLVLAGQVRHATGDIGGAERMYQRALPAFRSLGDRAGEANALVSLASVVWDRGDKVKAEKLLEDAASLDSESGNREGLVRALNNLALLEMSRDDLNAARVHFEESLRLADELGLKFNRAYAEINVGGVRDCEGNLRAARSHLWKALQLAREIHDPALEANSLEGLGAVLMQEGRLALAESAFRLALAVVERSSERMAVPGMRHDLARLLIMQGRFAEAESCIREAMSETVGLGGNPGSYQAVLAVAQAGQGKPAEARRTLDQAVKAASKAAQESEAQLMLALAAGRVALAEKQPLAAVRALDSALQRLGGSPHPGLLYEVRLWRGGAELAAGRAAEGCGELRSLAQATSSKGYGFVAGQAERLLAGAAECKAAGPPPSRKG
jgi:eukaryotic-like serine/threonine-protein kinase